MINWKELNPGALVDLSCGRSETAWWRSVLLVTDIGHSEFSYTQENLVEFGSSALCVIIHVKFINDAVVLDGLFFGTDHVKIGTTSFTVDSPRGWGAKLVTS